jgi:hypothetical protein
MKYREGDKITLKRISGKWVVGMDAESQVTKS